MEESKETIPTFEEKEMTFKQKLEHTHLIVGIIASLCSITLAGFVITKVLKHKA